MRRKAVAPDLEPFWQCLKRATKRALLLDYDGTLAPFRVERDKAIPYPGVRETIDAILADGQTRLVIISGRWTRDLIPLLGLTRLPEIWGCHGWERLFPDGSHNAGKISGAASRALKEAQEWAHKEGCADRCERKPVAVAIHWRGLEAARIAELQKKVSAAWEPLARRGGLELHSFDGGLELRCPGRDKGFAVNQVFAELGEDAVVAYLGDDLTDEDAFGALKGKGLSVLVREEFRSTEADVWLKPPEELLEFLRNWRRVCGKKDRSE